MYGYHTSNTPIPSLLDRPIWFALEREHATHGWALTSTGESFFYRAHLHRVAPLRRLATLTTDVLTSNPTAEEILSLPEIGLLREQGFDGLLVPDYDPRDYERDLVSVCMFQPLRGVSGWSPL